MNNIKFEKTELYYVNRLIEHMKTRTYITIGINKNGQITINKYKTDY